MSRHYGPTLCVLCSWSSFPTCGSDPDPLLSLYY
nr:hypothetical protein SEVIR_2G378350v2 [Setaria viridis]